MLKFWNYAKYKYLRNESWDHYERYTKKCCKDMSADTDACTTKRAHTKRYCVNISCYSWKCTKTLELGTLNKDQVRTFTPTFVLVTIVQLISRRLLWCRKIRQIMEHKNEDFFCGWIYPLKGSVSNSTNRSRVNIKENFVNFGETGQG